MKYTSEDDRRKQSVASHGQANATVRHEAESMELRKTADAVAALANSFQAQP